MENGEPSKLTSKDYSTRRNYYMGNKETGIKQQQLAHIIKDSPIVSTLVNTPTQKKAEL